MKSNKTLFYGFTDKICLAISKFSSVDCEFISIYENPPFYTVGSWIQLSQNCQEPWDPSICHKDEFAKILGYSNILFECYSRHFYYAHRRDPSPQVYNSIIRSHYVVLKRILLRVKPARVFFSNIPHEGFDNLLQIIAEINHIESYACFQLPFGPRFFCVRLNCSSATSSYDMFSTNCLAQPLTAQNNHSHVDAYIQKLLGHHEYVNMSDLRPHPRLPTVNINFKGAAKRLKQLTLRFICSYVLNIFKAQIAHLMYQRYQWALSERIGRIKKGYHKEDYIYVPLHLQPEISTSVLGSIFCDQTIALSIASHLARKVGCTVLCKENPKQSYPYRSSHFFEACDSIDNVFFVDSSTDSRKLIRDATMVVTATGTAGLEAVASGVPVYCLGDAWWGSVTGVSKSIESAYSDILKHKERKHSTIACMSQGEALAILRSDLIRIENVTHSGCSDSDYLSEFSVNEESNSEILARSLVDIINRLCASETLT